MKTCPELDQAIADSEADAAERKAIIARARQQASNKALQTEVRLLRTELESTQRQLDTSMSLGESLRRPVRVPAVRSPKGKHPGAFVLLCSDWHLEERVDAFAVGGRNEYNPAIAEKRVGKLIEGARWMLEAWRSGQTGYGWQLETVVCWIGGDMISNTIHDDLRESNFMSPTEATLFAGDMIRKTLEGLSAHPGIKQVLVPTSYGNHGRDTPLMRVSTGWKRSYEWMLYQMLATEYANHPKIRVIAGRDEISTLDVLGHKLRFAHGDQLRYGGGVGGLTVPLIKWLHRLDQTEKADVTQIGHFHNYLDIGHGVVNGSLIGWNAYAQHIGAAYGPAAQVCYLLDAKRGKRMSTEIVVQ